MSWLAAARNRVLEMLASSASALARPSSALRRVSSLGALAHPPLQRFVGALERLRGLDARRDVGEGRDDAAVRHRLARTSMTRPRSAKRSRNGSLPGHSVRAARAPARRSSPGPSAPCSALKRRISSSPTPTRVSSAAGREFRRTAGSSRSDAGPCRTPRCPGAHGRARSAGFRGCTGSPHWRRRAA